MRINALFLLTLLFCLVFEGCVSLDVPVASDKSFPPDGRYEILGPVTHTGSITSILGLINIGGTGYLQLYQRAMIRLKADDIVSVSYDKNVFSILGVYTRITYTLRGTAIRYINPPSSADKGE